MSDRLRERAARVAAAVGAVLLLAGCTATVAPAPSSPPPPSSRTSSGPAPSTVPHPPLALQHAAYLALPFTTILTAGHEDSVGRVFATGTTISAHESMHSGEVWCAIASSTTGQPERVAFVRTPLRSAAGAGLTYGRFWVRDPEDCASAVAAVLDAVRTLAVDPQTGVVSGQPSRADVIDARTDVDRFLTGHSPTQDLTTLGIQVYEAVLELGPSSY